MTNVLKLVLGLGGAVGHNIRQNTPSQLMELAPQAFHDCKSLWLLSSLMPSNDLLVNEQQHYVQLPPLDVDGLQQTHIPPQNLRQISLQHFKVHQQQFWNALQDAVKDGHNQSTLSIVLLIDMTDIQASSIYLECLYAIRQRYPAAKCYPIFLLPTTPSGSPLTDAHIAAAVLELNAVVNRQWLPENWSLEAFNSSTKQLWEAAYVQYLPHSVENTINYPQLIEMVFDTINHQQGGINILQSLQHDAQKASHSAKEAPLGRFITGLQAELSMNIKAVQELFQLATKTKLLRMLAHQIDEQDLVFVDFDYLQRVGWVLGADILLLNQDDSKSQATKWEPIDKEWQVRGEFLVKQLAIDTKSPWNEQLTQLRANFQKIYDKNFRNMGVDLYYSISQTRMEQLTMQHGKMIEQKMWAVFAQGKNSITEILYQFDVIATYYQRLQQQFEQDKKDAQIAIRSRQQQWEEAIAAWQSASKRDKTRIQEQYDWALIGKKLTEMFQLQTEFKAYAFASKWIDELKLEYERIRTAMHKIESTWGNQANEQYEAMQEMLAKYQHNWVIQISNIGQHQYLLQPTPTSFQILLQSPQQELTEWVQEMVSTWTKTLGNGADFEQFQQWLSLNKWQPLPNRIAEQWCHTMFELWGKQNDNPMAAMFDARIQELSVKHIQQLAKHANDTLAQTHAQNWLGLGKVLSETSLVDERVVIKCPERLQGQEVISVWQEATAQQHPNVQINFSNQHLALEVEYVSTCYLQEWRYWKKLRAAYHAAAQTDSELIALHLEPNVDKARSLAAVFEMRNRDLIRQQLVLAQLFTYMFQAKGHYYFSLEEGQQAIKIEAQDLAALVDAIPLPLVRQLLEKNRTLREASQLVRNPYTEKQLDELLERLRLQYIPADVDLADADWKVAGRYVVWVRAVQHIRKYWLSDAPKSDMVFSDS